MLLSPVHTKNDNYNDISIHTSEQYCVFILSTHSCATLNSPGWIEEERRALETQVGEQNMTLGNMLEKTMSKTHSFLINNLKSTGISERI